MELTVPCARAKALVLWRYPNAWLSDFRPCSITKGTDHYNGHAWGNALDVRQRNATHPLAMTHAQVLSTFDFAMANHEAYEVDFILWDGVAYDDTNGWLGQPLPPDPFPQHYDHVHISFLPRFTGTPEGCPELG